MIVHGGCSSRTDSCGLSQWSRGHGWRRVCSVECHGSGIDHSAVGEAPQALMVMMTMMVMMMITLSFIVMLLMMPQP